MMHYGESFLRRRWRRLTGNAFNLEDSEAARLAQERFAENLPVVRTSIILGVGLYGLFGVVDPVIPGGDLGPIWGVRYGVICPLLLLLFALTFVRRLWPYLHVLLTVTATLAGLGLIVIMGWLSEDPGHAYYAGLIVIAFYLFSFLRLPLAHATCAAWFLFFSYLPVALWINPIDDGTLLSNTFFLVTGNVVAMVTGLAYEISYRRGFISRRQVEEREQQLTTISRNLPGIVFRLRYTEDGIAFDYVSDGSEQLIGIASRDMHRLRDILSLLPEKERLDWVAAIRRIKSQDEHWAHEGRMTMPRTGTRWISVAARREGRTHPVLWDGVALDTTSRHEAERRANYLASFDSLTDLPNRDMAVDRLEAFFASSHRRGQRVAIAILNLRRFRLINRSFGLKGGDEVLRCIAERLTQQRREDEVVARMTADHFLFAFGFSREPAEALSRLNEVIDALAQPVSTDRRPLSISITAGVSVFPDDGDRANALIAAADAALGELRLDTTVSVRFFQSNMNQRADALLSMESELREALECGMVVPYYQPQVSLDSGRIIGVEALARWTHPEKGEISPAKFIPVAEETGLISRLCDQILAQACADWARWGAAPAGAITVSINLSGRQRLDTELAEAVLRKIEISNTDPTCVEFEITESQLIQESASVQGFFDRLSEVGVHFAVDDFGTGYSSFASLSRFPVSKVKIDRSFLQHGNQFDIRMLQSVISVADSLGMTSVAEGVETQKQADMLRSFGCNAIQGYLIAPAISSNSLIELLSTHRTSSFVV